MSLTEEENIFVVLADDDEDDHYLVKQAFFELGIRHELRSAYNGYELLDFLRSLVEEKQFLPHFILLDLNMPGLSGFSVLEELAKDERLSRIPVYVLSTSSLDLDKKRSEQLGAARSTPSRSLTSSLKK